MAIEVTVDGDDPDWWFDFGDFDYQRHSLQEIGRVWKEYKEYRNKKMKEIMKQMQND